MQIIWRKKMSKIVGIKIDAKSNKYNDKIYYYETDNEDLKRGDVFRAEMPSGGTPKVYVSIADIKKKINNIKPLKKES